MYLSQVEIKGVVKTRMQAEQVVLVSEPIKRFKLESEREKVFAISPKSVEGWLADGMASCERPARELGRREEVRPGASPRLLMAFFTTFAAVSGALALFIWFLVYGLLSSNWLLPWPASVWGIALILALIFTTAISVRRRLGYMR